MWAILLLIVQVVVQGDRPPLIDAPWNDGFQWYMPRTTGKLVKALGMVKRGEKLY